MTLALRPLTLLDTLGVCAELPDEEIKQWHQFSPYGIGFDAESIAATVWRESDYRMRWAICDAEAPGRALAAAGLVEQRAHVYRVFFLATPDLWKHGSAVTDITRDVMNGLLEKDAHRIEVLCLASRTKARAWYEQVGLVYESTLAKFTVSGADAVMYVATEKGK